MIGELLSHATFPWGVVLSVLLIFGFAPRLVLRLAALAFHRDDPRRAEMLAELHAVPRAQRPFWVAEQLEVALSEGLWERVIWAATGRIIYRWSLGSGVENHRKHPETFWIPDDEEKAALCPGAHVKLMFGMRDGWGERMWVDIVKVKDDRFVGTLRNDPVGIPRLCYGDEVKFRRAHVIDIIWPDEDVHADGSASPGAR